MLASACTAMAGLGVFVISGAWLDDEYGVSTGGLGLIAAGFGAVELVSSVAVAVFADRLGAAAIGAGRPGGARRRRRRDALGRRVPHRSPSAAWRST